MCRTRTQLEMSLHVYDPACDWQARMLEREHSCSLCNNFFECYLFQHVVLCIARAWFAPFFNKLFILIQWVLKDNREQRNKDEKH